jgi:hypothetical protein
MRRQEREVEHSPQSIADISLRILELSLHSYMHLQGVVLN